MSGACPNCDCYSCRKEYGNLTAAEQLEEARELEEARSWDWTPARDRAEQQTKDVGWMMRAVYATRPKDLFLNTVMLTEPFTWVKP